MFRLVHRNWKALLLSAFISQGIDAQTDTSVESPLNWPEAANLVIDPSAFSIEIDTIAEDIGLLSDADLTGFNTYRLYVTTSAADDQLSAVYGNVSAPSSLETSGSFFQSSPIGSVTAAGVFPEAWIFYPSNEFDSYVTIGIEGPPSSAENEGDVMIVESSTNPWTPTFEPSDGSYGAGFQMDDLVGGSWYTVSNYSNGIAGPDQRVLIAQLTTDGTVSGNLNVHFFLDGDTENPIYLNLTIPVYGCTDSSACNYDENATEDNGSCQDFDECGACGGDGIPAGDCDCDGNQLDALGICGGPCEADLDGDGLCDDVDDCVGTYDDCGICNGPGAINECGCDNIPAGDCDCDGNQLDALGVCGGECTADADGDGFCDDVDDCVGAYDDCGICNGPGAIYECGCTGIPAGDCDCNGNQLDALGICGGDCSADTDGDGICDDVDDCVGTLDDCGTCNGPGAIYECGCTGIPAGDCDCDGNQLDALGVCGGDCEADSDGDGVCDTDEVPGCTDDAACNFNPDATDEDGSCLTEDALGVCGGNCAADLDGDGLCDAEDDCIGAYDDCGICNGPGTIYECGCANIPAEDCDCDGNQLDALGVCGGDCSADVDGDGVCDDVDFCVGEFDACGICNGPGTIYDCGCADTPVGDCDCDGNQLDALGVCGGDCSADVDGDGICDDVDDCVGTLDDCGICNGPGAIYDCGCDNIPIGDCDCDGNQLDAVGICGGDCSADADGDGICDDVDDCVGTLDDCGICNGPGVIYDCGCTGIPAGDCDCDGNQLDALGVCGGDCEADLDGDGICDDQDDCIGAYDDCGICNGAGAIYECGCFNVPIGDCDCDGNQLDALGVCGGDCTGDIDGDGVCDTDEVPGCTDANAVNFDPEATDEDGTCQYSGCTDPAAENYSAGAAMDDGSCEYLCIGIAGCTYPGANNYEETANCEDGSCDFPPFTNEACMLDLDGNGVIGAADLIFFLGYYELSCEGLLSE